MRYIYIYIYIYIERERERERERKREYPTERKKKIVKTNLLDDTTAADTYI